MTVLRGEGQSRGQHDSYHERSRLPCGRGKRTTKAATRTFLTRAARGDQRRCRARWRAIRERAACGDSSGTDKGSSEFVSARRDSRQFSPRKPEAGFTPTAAVTRRCQESARDEPTQVGNRITIVV